MTTLDNCQRMPYTVSILDNCQGDNKMKLSFKKREFLQKEYVARWFETATDEAIMDLAYFAMMEKLDGMQTKNFVAFIERYDPDLLSNL